MNRVQSILACVLLLGGCANTIHSSPVNFAYEPAEGQPSVVFPTITVAKITDDRSVSDGRILVQAMNQFGNETSGGWMAEKPLTEIVGDALRQGFGTLETDARLGTVMVMGEIVRLSPQYSEARPGEEVPTDLFTSRAIMQFNLEVKLTGIEQQSGKIIWRDTVVGVGRHMITRDQKYIGVAVGIALNDLTNKLLSDELFHQAISDASGPME